MKLLSINIKNFKSIRDLTIEFNEKFNLIIGKNNVGKTSIFEAILLWKKCYDKNIQSSNKKKFYANCKNISFSNVKFLRISDDIDLFKNITRQKSSLEISIIIEDEGVQYNLGFIIQNMAEERNTYLQIKYLNYDEFVRFAELTNTYGKNLNDLIMISRSKPIAHISRKEPYMYKDQILGKIANGKSTEVLRNKIISLKDNKNKVEEYIGRIVGEEISFIEDTTGLKEYIKLKVNIRDKRVDLLSQGSGFLQLVEIFSSIEYKKSNLNILLIDEPDAHLHSELQTKLVDVIKEIEDTQTFIISHNERLLKYVNDDEVIFINDTDKTIGNIKPLENGNKILVVENLVDNIEEIHKLAYVKKFVLVEGNSDLKYIKKMYEKYLEIANLNGKNIIFKELGGIDNIVDKLLLIRRAYSGIVYSDMKWVVIRDNDFTTSYMKGEAINEIKKILGEECRVFLQDGYELYSVLFSDLEKLKHIISMKYTDISCNELSGKIYSLVEKYKDDCERNSKEICQKLLENFENQKKRRGSAVYKGIDFCKFISDAKSRGIQYIMTKTVIKQFLIDLNTDLGKAQRDIVSIESLFDSYIDNIVDINDFYDIHLDIMQEFCSE